ncbi:MAG: poly-beta-1,6-N-acetyl-D-glucosamine N-deacetylase PgaB [Steroidobacteraceae bacterium]
MRPPGNKRSILLNALVFAVGALGYSATLGADADPTILAICYHDVSDADPDQTYMAVSTDHLVQQFNWLRRNGYHPVSIDDLLRARALQVPLPDKPVLLTFDDGYASFYTRVFPLLKLYQFPAVLAVTGSWMKGDSRASVVYGSESNRVPRSLFISWDQVREVMQSGLIEIAAHTESQHTGIIGNPQLNSQPALTTRRFDTATSNYEADGAYTDRLKADADEISSEIQRETGHRPRVIAWPYGSYNQLAESIYAADGMTIGLTLDDGTAKLGNLTAMPRMLMLHDPDLAHFVSQVREVNDHEPVRAVQVDLDAVYDPDLVQQERNLDALIKRIYTLGVNVVMLQAFADPDGSGLAKAVYFPNRWLPVRADLFNRVAWQLRTRTHVHVYGWLPVLSYDFAGVPAHQRPAHVLAWDTVKRAAVEDGTQYTRWSPFDPKALSMIGDVYEDLARSGAIDGLLFHDDAELTEVEDASAPALAAYERAGLPPSIERIRDDPELRRRWLELKTRTLTEFTRGLARRAGRYRLPLKTMRNLYARVIMEADGRERFAQDLDDFLGAYDYTAVMAMPMLEGIAAPDSAAWLRKLQIAVKAHPHGLSRTLFELQAVDWNVAAGSSARHVPAAALAEQISLLLRGGAQNVGYYPDDFVLNQPAADVMRTTISTHTYPYSP